MTVPLASISTMTGEFMNATPLVVPPPAPVHESIGQAYTLYGDEFRRMADNALAADLAGKVGASDVVQDTFFAASRDLASYRGNSPREFRGWLEGIFWNRLMYLRRFFRTSARRQVSREVPLGWSDSGSPGEWIGEIAGQTTASPLSRIVQAERTEAFRGAVKRLNESDRQLIRWHSEERVTFPVISDRLGISEDAARKRWARALTRLRDAMGSVDASR